MRGTKLIVDVPKKATEVYIVTRSGKGYLVTEIKFKKDEEPKKVFHVTDDQVIGT
jgi:hypothetical protein